MEIDITKNEDGRRRKGWHGKCLVLDMSNDQQLKRFHSTSFGRASAVTGRPSTIVPIKMVGCPVEFNIPVVNVTDTAKSPTPARTETKEQNV